VTSAVFDTNVLASGFVSQVSIPGRLLLLWTYGDFELFISEHILSELEHTFAEIYFRKRLTARQRAANITLLRREASVTLITAEISGVATHPEDDLILATAVSAGAGYLVTGDKKLQRLGTHQGVIIVSPRSFLDILTEQPR